MKEQIIKMEKEIEKLKIESKEKDDAIIELSQFYYVSFIYIKYL
jgi:thiamine biosynthesis protein ThiC